MRFPRAITGALIILLVTSMFGGIALGASFSPIDAEQSPDQWSVPAVTSMQESDEPREFPPADPAQLIYISVGEDGNATWTVESRFVLESEDDEEAFLSYADSVVEGERDGGYDESMFAQYVEQAATATDREMAIRDAGYDTPRVDRPDDETNETDPESFTEESDQLVGVISYSFTWEGFATTDANRIYVGDAFQSPDEGSWFPELTGDQRLVIEIPENYAFETAPVATRDRTVVWDGPHTFGEDERELVLLRGAEPPGNGDDNGDDDPGPIDPGDDGLFDTSLAAIVGLISFLVLVGVTGSYLHLRRRDEPLPGWIPAALGGPGRTDTTHHDPDQTDALEEPRSPGTESTTTQPPASAPDVSEHTSDEGAETNAVRGTAGAVGADEEAGDEIDPELLSDEERVLRLLQKNGGRMKQASIVTETNWSNAKVSQLLSKMDDDDDIEKLRIGRENLITLPEVDLTELE
ncbi:hypothetical protein ACLI4R_15295 [Natrialbaceae archaeon A-chndr2]